MELFSTDPDSLEIIDPMLKPMIQMLGSGKVSKYGRDNIMELFIKFVTRQDGLGWPKKFIEAGGSFHERKFFNFLF